MQDGQRLRKASVMCSNTRKYPIPVTLGLSNALLLSIEAGLLPNALLQMGLAMQGSPAEIRMPMQDAGISEGRAVHPACYSNADGVWDEVARAWAEQ